MAELKNPKHEKFVQNLVRGLSPTEAYISAGYSGKGAHASETDRQDINVRADLQAQADVLRKAFTLDELEAMDARIEAARNGTQVIDAPAVAVPEVQPVPEGKPGCAAPTAPE